MKKYFKPVWRNIRKNKLVAAINMLGLSVGMTAAVFIFLWVRNETSFDGYHDRADKIYSVTTEIPKIKWYWETTPLLLAGVLPKEVPGVEKATHVMPYYGSLTVNVNRDYFSEKNCAYVGKEWFGFFHYDFIEGNPAAFYGNPFSVIMTESKARKYFGHRTAAGQIIRIDSVNYEVQGVVKDNPANSSFQFDLLLPVEAYLSIPSNRKNDESWNNSNYVTFLMAGDNANAAVVEKQTSALVRKYKKSQDEEILRLLPLKKMHFETAFTSAQLPHAGRTAVFIFTVLAVLLLLIACINYVNLTTAQASLRSKEVSVRKIIGAGRIQLFKQFLAESFFVSFVALVVTLVLVQAAVPLFNEVTEKHFVLPLASPTLWKVLGATLLTAALLNGVYPAVLLSSFKPLDVFKGIGTLRTKNTTFRKALVVVQFTISVALIVATIVIARQLSYIQHKDAGYNRSQVFAFTVPYKMLRRYDKAGREAFFNSFKQELLSQKGIAGATLASQSVVNLTSTNSGSADWEGHDTAYVPTVSQLSADADFKKFFEINTSEGRWFFAGSREDEHNFILNETAVAEFNIHTPVIGQRFTFQGDTGQIIGVVKDFHFKSLHEKITPLVIVNKAGWRSTFFVKADGRMTTRALASAQSVWKRFVANEAFDYTFLDDSFDKLYKAEKRTSTLIFLFSIIAILVSGLGVFGLTVFATEQRVKEIGIRKVLGATAVNILSLLSRNFILLVIIASAIAVPVAWWGMNKWLADFAYRINIDWWVFGAAALTALLIAFATVSVQAIKAAVANPVKSLRTE